MKTRNQLIDEQIFDYLIDNKIKDELYSSAYYVHSLMDQLELQKDKYIFFSIKHSIIIHLGGIVESILFQYVYKYFQINNNEKLNTLKCTYGYKRSILKFRINYLF